MEGAVHRFGGFDRHPEERQAIKTPPSAAPVGTVAMLFTDIEGSTNLARACGPAWADVLLRHHEIVRAVVKQHGGWVERTEGDAFFVIFVDPAAAVLAAVSAQRALRAHAWPEPVGELKVRMGLHVGLVERNATGYLGLEVHRAARIAGAAHGGQVLLSATTRSHADELIDVEALGRHRLKDFPEPVRLWLAVIDGRDSTTFPPLKTLDVRPTNLPRVRPRLLGRDDELAGVLAAFGGGERLVTLVGRGGIGKTSLALVAGEALLDHYPGGVWWVSLASVRPGDVAAAIGQALHLGLDDAPFARLVDQRVGGRRTLLVLDNFEHVLPDAPVVADLVAAAPAVDLLVTSQLRLSLGIERVVHLHELPADTTLRLLARQAVRAGAVVELDDPGWQRLAEALDGLPLAIELAAPQLRVLDPATVADRVLSSPAALKARARDVPERHQSLDATIAWTLSLLDTEPLALFAGLGTFSAPAAFEEIELVLGDDVDVLDAMGHLVDAGLVRRVNGDVPRFGMPEALRRAAVERLDASEHGNRWRRRHAERQDAVLWPVRVGLLASRRDETRAAAGAAEADAAIAWAARHDRQLWARLAAARAMWLTRYGHVRPSEALVSAVLHDADVDRDAAAVAAAARLFSWSLGAAPRTLDVERLGEGEVAPAFVAPDPVVRAFAFAVRAKMRAFAGDASALRDHEVSLSLVEPRSAAHGGCLMFLAQTLILQGQLDAALAIHLDLAVWIEDSDAAGQRALVRQRGDLALAAGDLDAALVAFAASLESADARGDRRQVVLDLLTLATCLLQVRPEAGLEVLGLFDAEAAELGHAGTPSDLRAAAEEAAAAARGALGSTADSARAAGRAVPSGQRSLRAAQLLAL